MTAQAWAPEPDWQPGDDLYDRRRHPNSLYLYNFRPQSEGDACLCPDAASWPEPKTPLPIADELGDFITEWHAWAATQHEETR